MASNPLFLRKKWSSEELLNVLLHDDAPPCDELSLFDDEEFAVPIIDNSDPIIDISVPINDNSNGDAEIASSLQEDMIVEAVEAVDDNTDTPPNLAPNMELILPESDKNGKKWSRKKMAEPQSWKKTLAKMKRSKGLEYQNLNQNLVPAKVPQLGILCRENCRLGCNTKIDDRQRLALFKSFYEKDVDGKNLFLWGLMEPFQPKQVSGSEKNRLMSYRYYLTLNGSRIQVCKDAILNTFDIGRKKFDLIRNQMTLGLPAPQSDMRGRHENRPFRVPEDQLQEVKNHIEMFPTEASHYSRNHNPNRLYLSSELSIMKMYDLYKDICVKNKHKPVTQCMYRKVFNTNYNFGFGVPRSDTCTICDKGEGNEAHIKMYKKAFDIQKKDKELSINQENNTLYMTFDLQKTLPLPKLSTSVAFYLRQLWLYNLGVHFMTSEKPRGQGYFHLWTENEASRGSEEIGSCLLSFFEDVELTGIKKLITWSDSCVGQNKNFFIISVWQYLILTEKFITIEHKFPPVGHTYMDSDRDFAAVEKEVRKYQNIYCVDKYVEIMNVARRISPFKITRMADKFVNIKSLPDKLGLYNRKKSIDGKSYNLREVRWIKIEKFGELKIKYSFDEDDPWIVINILKNKTSTSMNKERHNLLTLKPATNLPIQPSKFDDINKQVEYIPATKRSFYLNLKRAE